MTRRGKRVGRRTENVVGFNQEVENRLQKEFEAQLEKEINRYENFQTKNFDELHDLYEILTERINVADNAKYMDFSTFVESPKKFRKDRFKLEIWMRKGNGAYVRGLFSALTKYSDLFKSRVGFYNFASFCYYYTDVY